MTGLRPDDRLLIERLGGMAGMGLPGSHIRSRAVVEAKALRAQESRSVAALFAAPPAARGAAAAGADAFRYRLTLERKEGKQVIEVSAADLLASLQERVQDELV